MRITDNEGFEVFCIRDDNIKEEEKRAREKDSGKIRKEHLSEEEEKSLRRKTEIIKLVLLVFILITSTVSMIFSICSYYSQTGDQKLVFLENVMGKTDKSDGGFIVDTPEDIRTDEIVSTQVHINLPADVVQQNDYVINNNNNKNNKDDNKNQVVTATTTVPVKETTTVKSDFVININFASIEQLMELEGIGQAKAEAIVEYRNENGAFLTVDELLEVNGIGEKILEKNRHRITVDY